MNFNWRHICSNLNHSNNSLWTSRIINFDSSFKLLIIILNDFILSSILFWLSLINSISNLLYMLFKNVESLLFHWLHQFFNLLFIFFSDVFMNDFNLKMKSLLEFPQSCVCQVSFLKFNLIFVILKLFIEEIFDLIQNLI